MTLDHLLALLVIAACVWLAAIQLRPLWQARRMRGQPAPDVVTSDRTGPRLYYFWSPHCGQCRSMTPLIDRLVEQGRDIVKVDIMEEPALARAFKVGATPTTVVVRQGRVQQVLLGRLSEQRLLSFLDDA